MSIVLQSDNPEAVPTLSIAPEPHVLLFRRSKDYDQQQYLQQQMQSQANGKPIAGKNGRKK